MILLVSLALAPYLGTFILAAIHQQRVVDWICVGIIGATMVGGTFAYFTNPALHARVFTEERLLWLSVITLFGCILLYREGIHWRRRRIVRCPT